MAGFTFLQTNTQNVAESGGTVTFASISTSANTYLICALQYDLTGKTITLADNINGAWTKIVANDNLAGEQFEIWCMPVGAGGSITIVASGSLAANIQLVFGEYSGQLQSLPNDSHTALTATASGTAYGPLTTSVNGDALIWLGFAGGNQNWSVSSGFNIRANNNATGTELFDSFTNAAAAGSYSFTGTLATKSLYGALVAVKSALAATPTFNPVAGSYGPTQTVAITSATVGATIYYTTDGSTPTHASSSIANGGTISVSATETVNAIAGLAGFGDSAVGSAAYTISSGNGSWMSIELNASLRGSQRAARRHRVKGRL